MQIRPYSISDQQEVIQLWQDCLLVKPQNNALIDIERKLKVDPGLFLVGSIDDKVVATVMGGYEGHRGWINYLAVAPAMQRKGYARAIMNEVEALIKAKGCPKINLQIRDGNKDVLGFYAALGYLEDNVVSVGKRLEQD